MSNNVRVRPVGFWTFNSNVSPAEFELIDAQLAASVAGSGGTYAPTTLMTFGGLGVSVTGPFTASNVNTLSVNGSITIQLGATLQLIGNQIVNSGAIVGITSGAFLTVSSGGTFTTNAGSTNTLNGTVTIGGSFTVTSLGSFTNGITVTQATLNGNAITATGNGTGAGATLTGGTTGPGLIATNGTAQTAVAPTVASRIGGYIELTGTDPNPTVDPGADNALHGLNIPKAWVKFDNSYTIRDGYNIDTITTILGDIKKLTFKRPMANADYAVVIQQHGAPGGLGAMNSNVNAGDFEFVLYKSTDLSLGFIAGATHAVIHVYGRQ